MCIYIYAIFKESKWQIMLALIVSYNVCTVRIMTLSIVDITWKLYPQYVWSVVSESVTVIFTEQFSTFEVGFSLVQPGRIF